MEIKLRMTVITTLLLISSIISEVRADGYEVETVGGVLNPTNIVITLAEAIFLGLFIFGFILGIALIRIKKNR